MIPTHEPLDEISAEQRKKLKSVRDKETYNIFWECPLHWVWDLDEEGNIVIDNERRKWGVFLFADGSMAMGFEIFCTDPQFLSQEESNSIHHGLEAALACVQKNENLQVFWESIDNDENCLSFLEKNLKISKTPFQKFLYSSLIKREKERLWKGELKSYRCFIFLNIPWPKVQSSSAKNIFDVFWQSFRSLGKTFSDSFNEWISFCGIGNYEGSDWDWESILYQKDILFGRIKSLMSSFCACSGITARPIPSYRVYHAMLRAWSPSFWDLYKREHFGLNVPDIFYSKGVSFSGYCLLEDIEDGWGWCWKTGRVWHRLLSLRVPPENCDVGYLAGCMVARENTLIYNSQLSFCLKPEDPQKTSAALHTNLKIIKKQMEADPKEFANLAPVVEDMEAQLYKLGRSEGSYVFRGSLFVHLWHEDNSVLDNWESGILRAFLMPPIKAKLSLERYRSLPYYVSHFTPGFTRSSDRHRDFVYLGTEAAAMLPLMGTGKGLVSEEHPRASFLFETQRGSLLAQDEFARGLVSSWGAVAVGTTGSGKSLFYNMKIARTFSEKDIIFVLDGAMARGSYRSLCSLLNGTYIETSLQMGEKLICQNPLATEIENDGSFKTPGPEDVNRIVNIIEPMVRIRPTQALSEPERSLLASAVVSAFENFRDNRGRVYLRDVANALREKNKMAQSSLNIRALEMSQHLTDQWCFPHGPFRYFFDRDSSIEISEGFVVFDLAGVSENPVLRGAVVSSCLNSIYLLAQQELHKPFEEQRRIWVIIDEAWSALLDPVLASSLVGLYRAGRARNISTHCLTQQMSDFKKILIASDPATGSSSFDLNNNSILGNTTWFYLFQHDPSDVKITQEVLHLSENKAEEIRTLGGEPRKFREMVLYCRLAKGNEFAFEKMFIRPLPIELSIFSSDAKENAIKKEKFDKAIDELEQYMAGDSVENKAKYILRKYGVPNWNEFYGKNLLEMAAACLCS